MKMKLVPIKRFHNLAKVGRTKASPRPSPTSMCPARPGTRGGTAKLLTLFEPATGLLRAKGVTHTSNAVLHPWLLAELEQVLAKSAGPVSYTHLTLPTKRIV